MTILKILALADVHGNITAVKKLVKTIQTQDENIDLIMIAGDLPVTTPPRLMMKYMITHPLKAFSKTNYTKWVYKGKGRIQFVEYQLNSIKEILKILGLLKTPIIYTPGNVDCNEIQEVFKSWDVSEVYYLDSDLIQLGKFQIIGCGGAEFAPKRYFNPLCDMEFPPEEFRARLNPLFKRNNEQKHDIMKILLCHEPPVFNYKSHNDQIHGGSKAITALIDEISPIIVIFGHYHEFPIIKKEPATFYVNPGPLACYNFALFEIINQKIQVTLKRLNPATFDLINVIYRYRLPPPKLEQEFNLNH
ncbi:MAG: metallophosphoesterase [Candidatus Hodarchaeota archaeon]